MHKQKFAQAILWLGMLASALIAWLLVLRRMLNVPDGTKRVLLGFSFLSSLVILLIATGCVLVLLVFGRRSGHPRLAMGMGVLGWLAVLYLLPHFITPCGPLVRAMAEVWGGVDAQAAGAGCTCIWYKVQPCSGWSPYLGKNISCNGGLDQDGNPCLGCCFDYACPSPTPVPVTNTPVPTASRTPSPTTAVTPTILPTQTQTATVTPTSTLTPTPTPTPLPPVITSSIACARWGRNGWCAAGAQLILNASDPQGFGMSISGNVGNVPIACAAACVIDLPEGSGTARFTATSASGRTASGSQSWKYDASLPAAVLQLDGTMGANGWYSTAVKVGGIGTDNVSGVDAIEVSVDGSAWQPSAALSDGIYQVQAHVTDLAGWETLSAVQTVQIDTIPPDLSIIPSGIKGGGDYFRSAVTVSLVGTDAGSGIARVEYRLDGQDWVQASSLTITSDGDHSLEGRVTDQAGNVTWRGMAVHIDTIPPVAEFIMPAPNSTSSGKGVVDLGGKVSDVGSGIAGVEISTDNGKTWQALPLVNGIWRCNWDTTQLPNGTHPFFVRAWDLAGNVQAPGARVSIIAANQPPFVEVQRRWKIWESGSLSIRENGIPIDSVRITIRDPQGRWPAVVQDYTAQNAPQSISWNRHFANGILAPSGEYEVLVEARDVYGNESSAKGMIIIPTVANATATIIPTATPNPTATQTATMTQSVEATVLMPSTPVPPVPPPPAVKNPGDIHLALWPTIGLVGLLMALASAASADPRPRALGHMKKTFEQIMKNQGE